MIVNLIWCVRTVTDEGHSVRAINILKHYFEHFHITREPLRSNGFPVKRSRRRQRQMGRTERPILRPCVSGEDTGRRSAVVLYETLIDSRQVGPALDRYDDCMCVGLLSLSLVRLPLFPRR